MKVSWENIREVKVERRKKRVINYPHEAGYKKEGTSREAAEMVNPGLSQAKAKMLELLKRCPMTPKQMTDALNAEGFLLKGGVRPYENYCRSRFSELKSEGYIEETGFRGSSERGNGCDMVQLVEAKCLN